MSVLSISIMAHPSRKEWVEGLVASLGNVPVSWDYGDGVWANCRRAWQMHDPEAIWHLVLQDDAILCRDFRRMAERFLVANAPLGCAVSFYFGRTRMDPEEIERAERDGEIVREWLRWGLAVCLPVGVIPAMIESGDKDSNLGSDGKAYPDDTRIARFLKRMGMPVVYPIPSLVDHREGESLVGDPGRGRRAWRFLGTDA